MAPGDGTRRNPYSAAMACGSGGVRKRARRASALAAARCRFASLTWPKPRISSGKRRQLNRGRVIGQREVGGDLAELGFVIGDRLALGAALFGVPENVERRAAQPLQPRQHAECAQHPWPVFALLEMPGRQIALGDSGGAR
jgi:hypothetical protein